MNHSCQLPSWNGWVSPGRSFGPCPCGVPVEAKYQQYPEFMCTLYFHSLSWLLQSSVSSIYVCVFLLDTTKTVLIDTF